MTPSVKGIYGGVVLIIRVVLGSSGVIGRSHQFMLWVRPVSPQSVVVSHPPHPVRRDGYPLSSSPRHRTCLSFFRPPDRLPSSLLTSSFPYFLTSSSSPLPSFPTGHPPASSWLRPSGFHPAMPASNLPPP